MQNNEYFLNNLTKMIDFFADTYDNYLIMGDFNIERSDPSVKTFLNSSNLYNLIKSDTCFKGKGSCIELFLTNRKNSFNLNQPGLFLTLSNLGGGQKGPPP